MNYSFFQEQLQFAREKFALEPIVTVLCGGCRHEVNSITYQNSRGSEIIIDFGGPDVNLLQKFEELEMELKETRDNLSIFEKELVEKTDEIDELSGELNDIKLELAAVESEKEDLEITIEELTVNNRAICGNLEEAERRIKELEEKLAKLSPKS